MRVFIVSPKIRFDGKNILIRNKIKLRGVNLFPNTNFGTLYLASIAMKRGYKVSVGICCKYDFEEEFRKYDPDLFLISAMDIQANVAIYMAKAARSIKKSVRIVIGGYFPTACYETLLKELPWLDFAVIGEGEATLEDILSYYEGKIKSKNRIKGVAFVRKGKIVFTGYRELTNIDKLPFPARFLSKNSAGFLITSRGCYYNCRFCSINNFYRKVYRRRSMKNVVKEINNIVKSLEGKSIYKIAIEDDDFLIDKNTLYELEARLAKLRLKNVEFSCMMRLDHLITPGTLEQLERLNFSKVTVGLQNISEEVLNYFRTGINKSHIRKLIRLLKRKRKIRICIFYIINSGLPTETPESIRKNLEDFLSLFEGIKNIHIEPTILSPFSGSELGGKSPFYDTVFSEKRGFVTNKRISDYELKEIYSEFMHEIEKKKLYVLMPPKFFKVINDIFFFLTSSLRAKTKVHMVFDSSGWFFLAILKLKNPLNYVKERIEQKYFI